MIREEYVDLGDGAVLRTETQGAGRPVVLCAGGPGDPDNLGHVAAMIDDLTLVHRFDPRACGRSTGGPPFTLAGAIADLDRLREHWGHERWTPIGHSFGALTALAYACAYPSRTDGVVYVSCLVAAEADLQQATREYRAARSERGELGDRIDPAVAERVRAAVAADLAVQNRQVNDELGVDGMRHCSTSPFQAAVAALDVPVLIVHGEQDPRPMWAVEKVARTLPSAELVALPGVGHFPDLEVPERYRELVRGFLSG